MHEEQLLATWAERLGFAELSKEPGLVHGWGDMEVAFGVRHELDGYTVVTQNRGHWSTTGHFATLADADAFLLVCFGVIWRADRGLEDVFPADPAPRATIVHADGGYIAEVDGHRAVLARRSDAKRYTYVAGKSLREVADFLLA
ncbi:hypothetical protein AB1K54_15805 [Microbacterium sp. BWT-B31]|uniref:hypothetical protein n=1 Tax=Microbacterium sp. BWT-B31 TaxID=3232072 RepID=UPI0035292659